MATVPTVRIKNPDLPGDFIVINESDFDAAVHEKFEGERAQSASRPAGKPGDGGKESGSALPDGYEIEAAGGGGYYHLFGPEAQLIEGPSNGKWQGKDAALKAAIDHAAHAAARTE